ncbi:hypothetical protein [Streptomyces roseochromogenus]|uniref:Lipoprotein n=1 Tax=Streptomyces roseochromogenus subsp. oscitans DS 12.976 TaxID=1352936 RepID=V6KSN0_STRRC|nr:hypothetical protein [Streptomyces roseochromogenus]EST35165.1 hypothetical protein M878_07255 [Streptomyces roseochromogenus subsp. oscitans DS 12.976]
MMRDSSRPGRVSWPRLGAVLVTVSCLVTACGGSGHGSHPDATPPAPSADPVTRGPSQSSPGTPRPRCVTRSATLTHGPGEPSVHDLCVRSGTTVTVILQPRPQGPWPRPRTSNPMLALVTSTATDGKGATRVTVRSARTGSVTITWGPDSTPVFTLRLSVAAYPVQ